MFPLERRVTVICGHYGVGKTNLSLNLAIDSSRRGEKTVLIDLDIVNPYFRSSDYSNVLSEYGIRTLGPVYANTNLDPPALPPGIAEAVETGERVIIDAGGDDAGSSVLGVFRSSISSSDPDVLYAVNRYRSLTATAEEALQIMREIEKASGLEVTGIVNNSHMKDLTDPVLIADSVSFAERISSLSGLPLRFTAVPRSINLLNKIQNIYPVDVIVKAPWE